MSETILRPVADDSVAGWSVYPTSPTTKFDKIDEASHDGDSTYILKSLAEGEAIFDLTDWSDSGDTIDKVEVVATYRKTGGFTPTGQLGLKLSTGEVSRGTATAANASYTEERHEITRPNDGDTVWLESDLDGLQVMFKAVPAKSSDIYLTKLEVIVTHTAASNHPSPTSVEIDGNAVPASNVGEHFTISAIWQATGDSGTATHVSIEVSDNSGFSSFMWQSGWIDIPDIADNVRCDAQAYAGDYLSNVPPNSKYYVRVKFKDGSAVESDWSVTAEVNPVFKRIWHDTDSPFRYELTWITPHQAMVAGDTQKFNFKTGNRIIIAQNGSFNESIQASGGFQLDEADGKSHLVYLAETGTDAELEIWIATKDHITQIWGDATKVDGAHTIFDTHFFPVLCLDLEKHIHVLYGCHYTGIYHAKSVNPNDSSAWTLNGILANTVYATYPVAFIVDDGTSTGQLFVFFRYGQASMRNLYRYIYSTDGGETWVDDYFEFIRDDSAARYILYIYGIRFNKRTKRLYIAYTYVWNVGSQYSMGIWCAYCNWENTGTKFIDWYAMNGTYIGITDIAPIDYNETDGMVIRAHTPAYSKLEDHRCEPFICNMELNANGSPVIFFEMPYFEASYADETYLACAIWTGSAWEIKYISDQVNMMMRVRRSSVGVQLDRNGALQLIMPVAAKTYHQMLPAADEEITDVTVYPVSPTTSFDKLDDGLTIMDADQTYVDLDATSGKLSCSAATASNIPLDMTVLSVQIQFFAKYTSGSGNVLAFLDDGTSEDDGSGQALTSDYGRYTEDWAINPFTASAWELVDINDGALEFGIKNNAATVARITKMLLRAYCTRATDDKHASTELWLLESTDNGVTWNVIKELSRNSVVGVPIMNNMHHLENEQVGIIWCSGKDIFYYTDEPYGIFQESGIDLKLFYGDSEIDRILNYANLDESKIEFKLQEALAADSSRAPKDVVMYHGNKNTIVNPKGDPDNVYIEFHNAELFADGASMSGVDGWTQDSGTWTVYTSPPNHSNKVAGGAGSFYCAGAGVLSRTLGTNLVDIAVSCYMWMETSGGTNKIGIRLTDGANYFEAGVDALNNCFYINSNGTTTLLTDFPAEYKNYNKIIIQVTSRGCSVYVGEHETPIVREWVGSITQVDDLELHANSNSYFDLITVRSKREKTTAYFEEYGVNYYGPLSAGDAHGPPAQYSDNITSALIVVTDGKYDIDSAYDQIIAIDVELYIDAENQLSIGPTDAHTHDIRMYVVRDNPYPTSSYEAPFTYPDEILATIDFIIKTVGPNISDGTVWIDAVQYNRVELRNLTPGKVSLKIDYHDTDVPSPGDGNIICNIHRVDWWDVDNLDPVIQIGALDSARGWVMDAVLQGAAQSSWIMDGKIDGDFLRQSSKVVFDILQSTAAGRKLMIELKHKVLYNRVIPMDITGKLSIERSAPFDVLEDIAAVNRNLPYENKGGVSCTRNIEYEIMNYLGLMERKLPFDLSDAITASRFLNMDVLQKLDSASQRQLPFDIKASLEMLRSTPLEIKGSVSVDRKANFETLLTMQAVQRIIALEILIANGITRNTAFEVMEAYASTRSIPFEVEGLVELNALRILQIEIKQKLAVTKMQPFEIMEVYTTSRNTLFEITEKVYGARSMPFELKGGVLTVALSKIQFEILESYATTRKLPVEVMWFNTVSRRVQFDIKQSMAFSRNIPFEVEGALLLTMLRMLQFEIMEKQFTERIVPLETMVITTATRNAPLESTVSMSSSRNTPFEFKHGVLTLKQVPFEFGNILKPIARIMPLEVSHLYMAGRILNFEVMHYIAANYELPFEVLSEALLTFQRKLPFTWKTKLSRNAAVSFEVLKKASYTRSLPMEVTITTNAQRYLNIETTTALIATSNVLFELLGSVGMQRKIQFDVIGKLQRNLSCQFEVMEGMTATAHLSLEVMEALAAQRSVPLEIIGLLFAAVIATDAYLRMPDVIDLQMLVPDVLSPIIRIVRAAETEQQLTEAIEAYIRSVQATDNNLYHS